MEHLKFLMAPALTRDSDYRIIATNVKDHSHHR